MPVSQKRVTLADIARKAGCHVTTVSLALRDCPRLPEATRKRIKALAKKMSYRPDPLMSALVAYRKGVMAKRNTPTLAYVTNWATRWGWKETTAHPDFYIGAQAKAQEIGYKLEHFWLGEPKMTQKRLGEILYSRGINGVLLGSHGRERGDVLDFDWEKFSAVKIDYFPHRPSLHSVTNNQCDIVRLAMRKVIARGYRRIGLVMHRGWDYTVDHLWMAGYLCEQQVLRPRERIPAHLYPKPEPMNAWLAEGSCELLVEGRSFAQWFEKYRPEVILSKSSFVLPVMKRLGLRVPSDVALVDLFLECADGATAGVEQNHKTVGAVAVEILAGQLQHGKYGVPANPKTTYVGGTWHEGASCPVKSCAEGG